MSEDVENVDSEIQTLKYIIDQCKKAIADTAQRIKHYENVISSLSDRASDKRKMYYMSTYVRLKAQRSEALERLKSAKALLKRIDKRD